jgi:hypothetical protein
LKLAKSQTPQISKEVAALDLGSDCDAAQSKGIAAAKRFAQGAEGVCASGRAMRKLGEITVRVADICKSQAGWQELRNQGLQEISEADSTIEGSCDQISRGSASDDVDEAFGAAAQGVAQASGKSAAQYPQTSSTLNVGKNSLCGEGSRSTPAKFKQCCASRPGQFSQTTTKSGSLQLECTYDGGRSGEGCRYRNGVLDGPSACAVR